MEQIVIEVSATTARKWRKASTRLKLEVSRLLDSRIPVFLDKKKGGNQTANEKLFSLMKKASTEAKSTGLTEKKLDELLKDE